MPTTLLQLWFRKSVYLSKITFFCDAAKLEFMLADFCNAFTEQNNNFFLFGKKSTFMGLFLATIAIYYERRVNDVRSSSSQDIDT